MDEFDETDPKICGDPSPFPGWMALCVVLILIWIFA
jgi:hypothetical protein